MDKITLDSIKFSAYYGSLLNPLSDIYRSDNWATWIPELPILNRSDLNPARLRRLLVFKNR